MTKMISVDDLEDGMILGAPLVNRYGQVLIANGTRMESRHKTMLKTWGIKLLTIQSDEGDEPDFAGDEKLIGQAEERLARRMLWKPRIAIEENM